MFVTQTPRALRIPLYLALLLLSLSACTPSPSSVNAASPVDSTATAVLIVRHAEKADPTADDPELSEAGQQRAALLSEMTAASGISAIYATQYVRTRQTVEPLAKQLRLKIEQVDSEDVNGLADQILADHRGGTVLVAAHSNSVPLLVERLTGKPIDPIEETEYDNLYVVVTWGIGKGSAVRLRYGSSSTPSSRQNP